MKIKATLISLGAFGLSKEFVTLTKFGRRDYAQYKNVPFFQFIEKGKRTEKIRTLANSEPTLLILDGHLTDIEPPSGMERTESGTVTRFGCYDPKYKAEAIEFFRKTTGSGVKVLLEVYNGNEYVAPELLEATK